MVNDAARLTLQIVASLVNFNHNIFTVRATEVPFYKLSYVSLRIILKGPLAINVIIFNSFLPPFQL